MSTIQIFIKQISGKTIRLEVEPEILIADLALRAYEQRSDQYSNLTIENFARAVNFLYGGKRLSWALNLSDYNVKSFSTIHEVLKSWTMGFNVDIKTLTATCPISLEEIEDPMILGCNHVFERAELLKMLDMGRNSCPLCQRHIHYY